MCDYVINSPWRPETVPHNHHLLMRLSVGMRKLACVITVDCVCILVVRTPCLLLNLLGLCQILQHYRSFLMLYLTFSLR